MIEKEILKELGKTIFNNPDYIEEIRSKNDVYVYKIYKDKSYVVKYFKKEEFIREIQMYKLLNHLGIKTLEIFAYTDNLIVMEDIKFSNKYRLGVKEDLLDEEVAVAIAKWYMDFHFKGTEYLKDNNINLYKETDAFTTEAINNVMNNTNKDIDLDFLIDNVDKIHNFISKQAQTLNYNDFYYTNLIVSLDKKEAFMYDYNFMGQGLKYFDIRNVTCSLSNEAKDAFLKEYGPFKETEIVVDEAISTIINLNYAFENLNFPQGVRIL